MIASQHQVVCCYGLTLELRVACTGSFASGAVTVAWLTSMTKPLPRISSRTRCACSHPKDLHPLRRCFAVPGKDSDCWPHTVCWPRSEWPPRAEHHDSTSPHCMVCHLGRYLVGYVSSVVYGALVAQTEHSVSNAHQA